MASNSELMSIARAPADPLRDAGRACTAGNAQTDAVGSSTSPASESLEQGDRMPRTTSENASLAFSSIPKDSTRDIKEFISEKVSRIEDKMSELEGDVGRRLAGLEDNMSREFKVVRDRLTSLEDNVCTSREVEAVREELPRFEGNVSTSKEVEVITPGRPSFLEKTMSTSEEIGFLREKLEEKLASLQKSKHSEKLSTDLDKTLISKETTVMSPQFHSELKGKKVKLTSDFRTAERINPQEDSGYYGSVLSQRALCDNEVFQFRIEETLYEWLDWGFAFGVITDPGLEIKISTTIGFKIKGTWAIYSVPHSRPGTSNTLKYGSIMPKKVYPLQTNNLSVGTVFGVSRRENGDLHFYVNGVDKGTAFKDIPKDVYAFVDVMNSVSKISVVG